MSVLGTEPLPNSDATLAPARPGASRGWAKFLVRRLSYLTFVLLAVTSLVSVLVNLLPGDAARAILGEDATQSQVETVRRQLHLNDPIYERYVRWLWDALHGNLGVSYRTSQPVSQAITQHLQVSLELMILGQVTALLIAIPFACWAAHRAQQWPDRLVTTASIVFISSPSFVVGIVITYIFALKLGWLPATGFRPLSAGLWPNISSLILPVLAMSAETAAVYQRLLRADMYRTLQEDFVVAARAKGMSTWNILFRQALRPSSFTLVTLAGINTARLIGGLIVIETLFALPGMGRLLLDSIETRDFLVIQGVVAVIAVAYVIVNLVVDLLYLWLDPRVRSRG